MITPDSCETAMAAKPSAKSTELDHHEEYRLLADSIPVLAWIAHADGSIFWYNRRWYEYTGTTLRDMEGWGWQTVHDPGALVFVLAKWQGCIRDGQAFEMTFPLKGADGTFRPFLTRVVPLRDDTGRIIRWFGTNTDVAEELRAANALRESEQRFRIATEAVSGVLWTNSSKGEMQGEQPGWSDFTGQTREQYSGYGWASALHPDDAQPTIDAWQLAVRESRLFSFEHRVRRHDGAYRHCSVRALPIRDANGVLREWVGVHTDITEQLISAEALRVSEQRFRIATEAVTCIVWTCTPDGQLEGEQPSWSSFTGQTYDEYRGYGFAAALHPDDVPPTMNAWEQAVRTGNPYAVEQRIRRHDGVYRSCSTRALPVRDAQGDILEWVGTQTDITQQKQSAEALIRSEKLAAVGRLASSIAHEINNPLEAVTNILYLLMQSSLDEEQRSYCTTMMTELQHVSAIATHTLRFHRQSTNATDTRLDTLIQSVLTLFEGKIRNTGVEVACKLSQHHIIHAFHGEIRQVIANLIGNAIDAMSTVPADKRRLSIRTHRVHHPRTGVPGIAVTVGDTGFGISAAVLGHIFDPFFTTKGDLGTGLGLWVSSEIVRKHQGEIRMHSRQGPGRHGTVARVFLPLTAAAHALLTQ